MTTYGGHDPTEMALEADFQEKLEAVRPLSKYRLHYVNRAFPVLSFLYGVMAGGEFTQYCDHTDDYVAAYLGFKKHKPIGPSKDGESHRLSQEAYNKLKPLFDKWEKGRGQLPPLYPTDADWKVFLELLFDELRTAGKYYPTPLW